PSAAIELRLRREERETTAGAPVCPVTVLLVQRARARPLGAVVAQHLVLLRRELRAPLRVALRDLEGLARRPFRHRALLVVRRSELPSVPRSRALRARGEGVGRSG